MMEYMEKLKNYWRTLEKREQAVLGSGVLFVVIFIAYVAIWVPVRSNIEKYRLSVPKKQQQLATMRQHASVITQNKGDIKHKISGNVLSRVEKVSNTRSLSSAIETMEPQGDNGVRLVIPEIEFNSLLDFINALSTQSLKVDSITLDAIDTPGMTSARLVLIER